MKHEGTNAPLQQIVLLEARLFTPGLVRLQAHFAWKLLRWHETKVLLLIMSIGRFVVHRNKYAHLVLISFLISPVAK